MSAINNSFEQLSKNNEVLDRYAEEDIVIIKKFIHGAFGIIGEMGQFLSGSMIGIQRFIEISGKFFKKDSEESPATESFDEMNLSISNKITDPILAMDVLCKNMDIALGS